MAKPRGWFWNRVMQTETGTITFRRSLLLKLILAFWVVSIFGILIVALLAGRVSQVEFVRFINETSSQGLVDQLSSYYTQHGNFTGAGYLLEEARSQAGGPVREYVLVDTDGNVLLALAQQLPPGLPSPDFTRFGLPITANSHVVAYLIPMRPPRSPADSAVGNLQRINFSLFVGVVFATLVALIFALVMARNITRPLRNLNAAAQSIAQGNFENQVAIATRDEIGALAASFNQMVVSLKRSRDLRRQMTADIAHELRNPLSIILGNAEALSDGVLPATHETLEIIYDEAKHLSRLVDDLRTLSLSESGELPLQRSLAAPQEIVNRCATAYAMRAAEKGITIRAQASPDLPCVNVDVERIGQVLANLVDNSLKHTPAGGSIILSAASSQNAENGNELASEDGINPVVLTGETAVPVQGEVNISVEDSGFGIQPDDLPFVFDRFYRGKQSAGRLLDGSGLGLAISKAMVELHGGKIFIESQPGKGTKITISLPIPL